MSIRAVIFDLGGVLLNLPGPSIRYAKWEQLLGLPPGKIVHILRHSGFNAEADTGKYSQQDIVPRLATLLGLNEQQAGEFLNEHTTNYELNHELTEFLKCLYPRYQTAILSNAWPDVPKKMQERYHFEKQVDMIIYSCLVGLAKPNPAIFYLACQRLGIGPEEALFIDDTMRNVEAARDIGIKSVLFQHNAQAITEMQAYLDALPYNSSEEQRV